MSRPVEKSRRNLVLGGLALSAPGTAAVVTGEADVERHFPACPLGSSRLCFAADWLFLAALQ